MRTCHRAGAQRNLPLGASEIASRWNICFANVKCSLTRTWANFISHRAERDISQCATAHYFTFCFAKHFTVCICVCKFSASYAFIKDYKLFHLELICERIAQAKAPLCKGSCREATEGLSFTTPPSAFGCHLPLHRGGFFHLFVFKKIKPCIATFAMLAIE